MGKKGKKRDQAEKQKKNLTTDSGSLIYFKSLPLKLNTLRFFPAAAALAGVIYYVSYSFSKNSFSGFPLDDPWIHLTFAKNLAEFGSFSYYKNEIITSGSTSPLYTLLLSFILLFIRNEFIASYLIGIAFGVLTVYTTIKLFQKIIYPAENSSLSLNLLIIFAGVLAALQPKLNLINASGMETSMFVFFIAASLYAYIGKKMILLGMLMGLTVWCRPDGLVLWGAVFIDYFFREYLIRKNGNKTADKKSPVKIFNAFSIAMVFLAAYFAFNYFLSGSILPNTYGAKLEYYMNNDRSLFLKNEVMDYFTKDEFSLLWIPFIAGVIVILRSVFKKEYNGLSVLFLFITGLILVYYIKLPFAHRFGRYLMPVIPFYIIIALSGVKLIIDFIAIRIIRGGSKIPEFIFILYSVAALGFSIHYYFQSLDEYTFFCRYHNDRHVAAGKWLEKNTDESAVIAAHDVGAIAFYSGRRIVDMAGLITPELIDQINTPTYSEYLNKYLEENKIDYIAALRNWFEVVNDKPVYVPVNAAEFLEIFKYNPSRTHIQPKEVSYLNQSAVQMAQRGSASNALAYLNQSLKLDRNSSQTYFILGAVYEMIKDYPKAEQNFNHALKLFPEYAEACFGLAKIYLNQNKIEDFKNYLNKCLAINPAYQPAIQLKNKMIN